MKIQTYTVIAELNTSEPVNVGQTVYEWPHADWGLAGPDDILICTKLHDITTIYAVPKSCLKEDAVIDAALSVGAMTGCAQPEEDARVGAGLLFDRSEALYHQGGIVSSNPDNAQGHNWVKATFANPDDSKVAEIMKLIGGKYGRGYTERVLRNAFAELRGVAEMFKARLELATEQMLVEPKRTAGAEELVRLINELRHHEGDDVTFLCDNPDPAERGEQCAVRCCGEWTGWHEKAFMGETVVLALHAAANEMHKVYGSSPRSVSRANPRDGERHVAAMLCAAYWRGYQTHAGLEDEAEIARRVKAHLDDWMPAAQLALSH